ncbi:MAG: cation-translocating P-type ATPase [Lachnospiraceae bacterium]
MREWHKLTGDQVLKRLETGKNGLTGQQVDKIRETVGANILIEGKRKKAWQVFLEQFQDLLVIILLVAAVISMLSDNVESTVVIFAVIIMNAMLGTIQHQKAEKSLDSLKDLSSPSAIVIRSGMQQEIASAEVVPGDIVLVEAGDVAVADGRLLETYNLQVNESSLTGESLSVDKQAGILRGDQIPLAEQTNMLFSGTMVTGGRGVVVVTATGMNTEIGKIAALMNDTEEKKTPLQISLDQFSGRLAGVIMIICALIFALSMYRGMPVLDSLMFAVALAVAAIPEALGSIVTIVQAMGTQRMAKEHAIIKDLKAVESLGCVSVICSDKTGTLTQNRMTVEQVYADGKLWKSSDLNAYHPVHRYLLYNAVLDNDAVHSGGGQIGDPTETALLEMGEQAGIDIAGLRKQFPRLNEIPFDSGRKRMSTVHQIGGKAMLLTKGAMDVLLDLSDSILTADGIMPLGNLRRQKIQQQNNDWSAQGLRVLAFVYRDINNAADCGLKSESNYIFVGMAAMMDPPRIESRTAVANACRAGIKPVMITGDHKITATAIGRKIGMYQSGDMVITGAELDGMSDEQLRRNLNQISVYARVSPEHKIRIVDAWQNRGNIVAMTGDGVNDAPALKKADIGVAMGITGTDVSKDAASMILTDDNFATIIKAVANGRNVYRNIRHAIQFLLSGNMAGIFSVVYTSLLNLPMPFAPVHLLFINLLTDSLPAIAIGMEPQEEGLLDEEPRDPGEGILTLPFLTRIMVQGGLIALCTMMAYHTGMETGGAGVASTMAFITLTLARLFHGFNCRSQHSIIRLGLFSNLWSVMAWEAGVVLLAAVIFLPGMQVLFAVADLSLRQLATVGVLALIPTLLIQAVKTIQEAAR